MGGSHRTTSPISCGGCAWRWMCCPSRSWPTAAGFWRRPSRRSASPSRAMTRSKSTMPWRPISRPIPPGRSGTFSGRGTITRCRNRPPGAARRSPIGTTGTRKRTAGETSASSGAISRRRSSGSSPGLAHAELVIVHPEEFCRAAEDFLMQEE